MTGTIQGLYAVLSFYKNNWIPFVCASDVSITLTATKASVRTAGDGQWKKYSYQDSSYAITLSGLLKFDTNNWTGWDMLDNMMNFNNILFRCSFDDQDGNVKTVQGYCMIEETTLSWAMNNLVKNDFQLQGTGKLDLFDGLIPCPAVITDITVDGQEEADGIVHVSYDFTGDAYQVKYRIDGTGDFAYALAAAIIDVPGLIVGDHSIEIIPVCLNGYEGTGLVQDFIVTQALTCPSAITGINITAGSAANVRTGPATQMKYRIDGGAWINSLIVTPVNVGMLPVGAHTLEEVPVCSNGVSGTGFVKNFTITVQPALSVVNYSFLFSGAAIGHQSYAIYVNGVLTVSSVTAASGTISVPNGATVNAVVFNDAVGKHLRLRVIDITTSVTLNDTIGAAPTALSFSFTASGDTYSITETISD